jgi:uncharacterized protein
MLPVTQWPGACMSDWIETNSGRKFDLDAFTPDDFVLEDVAASLSRQCRYNGHTRRHYSVAEHACILSDHVMAQGGSPRDGLTALHHEDPEFAIGDMVSPLKKQFPGLKALEERMHQAVAVKFGTEYPHPDWLKSLDTRIRCDERRQVMNRSLNVWYTDALQPLGVRTWNVLGRFAWYARGQFLQRHQELTARMVDTGWIEPL